MVLNESWGSPKSVEFIVWEPGMCGHNFMATHWIVVEIFQSGQKWWTDWLTGWPTLPSIKQCHWLLYIYKGVWGLNVTSPRSLGAKCLCYIMLHNWSFLDYLGVQIFAGKRKITSFEINPLKWDQDQCCHKVTCAFHFISQKVDLVGSYSLKSQVVTRSDSGWFTAEGRIGLLLWKL